MNHILLIDGNNIAWANQHANKLSVGEMEVQAIYGFMKSMKAMFERTPGQREAIVLWDGRAEFRLEVHPEYKANREAVDEEGARIRASFQRQAPFIEKALALWGIKQLRSPLLEADDLAGYLVPRLAGKHRITLVSGDQDWIQLVRPGVTWFDPIRDRKVRHGTFLDDTGYHTPEAFVQGKALMGDSSDNCDGIPRIGKTTAQLLLARWGTVERFFAEVDAGTYTPATPKSKTAKNPHHEQVLASPEGRAIFARNMALMDLARARKPEAGELRISQSAPSRDGIEKLFQRLAFMSLLRELDDFMDAPNSKLLEEAA